MNSRSAKYRLATFCLILSLMAHILCLKVPAYFGKWELSALKTDGLFRSKGNLLVRLTDDNRKAPVRIETSTPLGNITVELVSAKSHPYKNGAQEKQFTSSPYSARNNTP